MRTVFKNDNDSSTLFDSHLSVIPRKGERVFIDDKLYKVKKVFHWYKNTELTLEKIEPFIEIDLKPL